MTDQNILRQDPGRETESAAYCGRTRATLPADAPISLLPSLTQLRNTTDTACQLSHFTEGRLEADRRALPVFVLMESKIKAGRANVHHPGVGPRGKTASAAFILIIRCCLRQVVGPLCSSVPAVLSCDLQNVSNICCLLHRLFIKCPMQSQLILA